MRVFRWTFMIIALVAITMNAVAIPAAAAVTATVCDSAPKYWCIQVDYTTLSGGAAANVRNIKGAINGGAWKWQRYRVSDYTWSSAFGWTESYAWGEGAWRYNVTMTEAEIDSIVVSRSMYAAGVAIVLIARYEER